MIWAPRTILYRRVIRLRFTRNRGIIRIDIADEPYTNTIIDELR
jgi:hypothetical protein